MLMNEENWPVTMPYEYTEPVSDSPISEESVLGSYELINHGTKTEKTVVKSETIELVADGKILGDQQGSWQLKEGNFIELEINEVSYQGVIAQQKNENNKECLIFSAVGNNQTVWGSKKN